jgi:hypothetical protein
MKLDETIADEIRPVQAEADDIPPARSAVDESASARARGDQDEVANQAEGGSKLVRDRLKWYAAAVAAAAAVAGGWYALAFGPDGGPSGPRPASVARGKTRSASPSHYTPSPRQAPSRQPALAAAASAGTSRGSGAASPAASPPKTTPAPASGPPIDTDIEAYGNCRSPTVKPTYIVLACADVGIVLEGLHWTSWTANEAAAVGTLVYKDCRPNCADGHFHQVADTSVILTTPVRDPHGRLLFSEIEFKPQPPGYGSGPYHGGPEPLPTRPI